MNRIIFYFLLPSMLSVTSVMGAISVRANEISNTSSKNFFYHWNGFEVEWHGPGIAYVEASDWDLIGLDSLPASGRSFTQAYSGNTFAYRMTSVGNWNTQQAYSLVGTHDGSSTDTPFQTYLSGLAPGFVNRHGGNQYGFGVDNGKADIFEHRNDKIDDPGEALIVTFDLEGELSATGGSFGPESGVSFENVGLHTYARLILKDFVVRNWNRNNLIGRIDYLFYDVSEDAIIQNSVGVDAFGENININDDILFTGPWSIEHGDILVFAHPTDPAVLNPDPNDPSLDISGYTSELWGMTFDLEFDAPEPEPINYDPNNIPQHPHQPGFSNIPRTDGELIALYRTEAGNDSIRTIVQDFHRGYLLTENRGSSVGNSRILFDLTDVTSANPSVEDPEQRTLDQVLIEPMRGAMHNAYTLAPDHRVNHPGDSYVDLAGLANNTPSIMSDYPDGFQQIGGGARSAYILPYHYSATNIVDARSGQEVSSFDAHGFGGGANPIPVGNILLIAKIRSGERAIASYDISDPGNPILLDVMRDADPRWRDTAAGAYEGAVYNQYLIVPQSRLGGNISFVDYSEPGNLRMHHIIKGTAGAQRYVQFQDHRMFAGTEVIDLTHLEGGITPTEHTFPGHKGEYMLPLGNIVICAENSEQGSANLGAIYAFQAEPDVRPPSVTYHVPAAGAVDQLVTSRIGLLVHETLDTTTLNHSTFKVFPVSDLSETSIDGTIVVSDKDILTFTPMENLQYDTTYRVVAEGFTDIVGNPIERYSFDFTTASPDTLFYPSIGGISLSAGVSPLVNVPLSFFIDATPDNGQAPGTLEYKWSFGDGTETDWIDASQGFSHIYSKIGQYQVVIANPRGIRGWRG
ncbi:MAG: Ig-like domain-containing protein, partial [Opitutales bacterium]